MGSLFLSCFKMRRAVFAVQIGLLTLWANGVPAAIEVYRVDADSPAPAQSADGQQWTTAFSTLDAALAVAQPGDEIWVAEGQYHPAVEGLSDPRRASFSLKDAVAVYGGFTGIETSLNERNPVQHTTILSGDLSGDDDPNGASGGQNNCYHVIQLFNGISDVTRLDGFTISGGYAVSPLMGAYVNGGGVYVESARLLLAQCIFIHNTAQNNGGAVYAKDSALTISDCLFDANQCNGFGAGVALYPDDLQSRTAVMSVARCVFQNNLTNYALCANQAEVTLTKVAFVNNEGGGLCLPDRVSLDAVNCVFTQNGGLWSAAYIGTRGQAVLTHCTLAADKVAELAIVSESFMNSSIEIANSILWNDQFPVLEYDTRNSSVSMAGCLVRGGFAGSGNLDAAPQFRLILPPCQPNWNSPAIDLCSDAGAADDIQGAIRPQNNAFDAGAYEFGEDSDGGGLPDLYENDHALNAADPNDDSLDSDGDGLNNLEEFRRGSDPQNDSDPPPDYYVSLNGSDETGEGAESNPWRTIAYALTAVPEGASTFPVTIHLGAGTFDEPVTLRPYLRLSGAGMGITIIRYYSAQDAEHTVVRAARGAVIEKCTITFPSAVTATAELLRVEEVDMEISEVEFNGVDSPHAIAVFITGTGSTPSSIHHCTVKRAEYGVFAVNSGVNITRNIFEDLFEAGIFVRPPEGKQEAADTPLLGDTRQAANTGFNRFRMSTGVFIKNMTVNAALAEYNDWGVYTEAEIQGRVVNSPGAIDYEPFLGKAMVRGGVAVEVLGADTDDPIPDNRHPSVTLSATGVSRDAASSLYLFSNLDPGAYSLAAAADGYFSATDTASVAAGDIVALTMTLQPSVEEGETEGEPEREGEGEGEKENAFLWCHGAAPHGEGWIADALVIGGMTLFLFRQTFRRNAAVENRSGR